jgi:hypothetical protein
VKPENGFDREVNRAGQIILAPHMAHLVREDCVELIGCEASGDTFRQE